MNPPRLLVPLVVLCATGLALAQPSPSPTPRPSPSPRISPSPMGTPSPGQMRFYGMDKNKDGKITRDEWRGNDKSFHNKDKNGDGVLSGDEVSPADGAPKERRQR
jgi:hypothetical protein